MVFTLDKIAKNYGQHSLFQDISITAHPGEIIGIAGSNGSGKSTLLKIISGFITPNSGLASLQIEGKRISAKEMYRYIALAAPYVSAPLDFKLEELIDFHFTFIARYSDDLYSDRIIENLEMTRDKGKTLRHFSSGMLVRLGLALALYSSRPILLLDEPTSNLDQHYKNWFASNLRQYHKDRICFLASNEAEDLQLADRVIHL